MLFGFASMMSVHVSLLYLTLERNIESSLNNITSIVLGAISPSLIAFILLIKCGFNTKPGNILGWAIDAVTGAIMTYDMK